ncbi:hypothetical protein ACFQ6C_27955 [Streptomyces sp. NPDC056454]|uniref:hypothetical protein n=1 Tax=Streptomyces sp. NPDC056454 TaxID=3345823 RepID=UPI0036979082
MIELDLRGAGQPAVLTAIIAHELGHVRLLDEDRVQGLDVDHERLTDLVTVFLGMGFFTANAAYTFTKSVQRFSVLPLGDLTERMPTGTALDPTHHLGYSPRASSATPWRATACSGAKHIRPGPAGWNPAPGPRRNRGCGISTIARRRNATERRIPSSTPRA